MTGPVTPAVLAGHVQNFLGQHGFPVRPFTLSEQPHGEEMSWARGRALPGEVTLSGQTMAGVKRAAGRYGRRGRLSPEEIEGLEVLLHEGVHQMRYGRTPDFYGSRFEGHGFWEEAATQAVARDLLPILTRKLFGHRMPRPARVASDDYRAGEMYPGGVRSVRQMSTIGTRSKHFQTWAARDWRRRFSHATPEERDRMRIAVEQIRAGAR